MATRRTIQNRVRRGAAVLDSVLGPDWVKDIDLDRLDLNSTCNCVLGQEFGGYNKGARQLFGEDTPTWSDQPRSKVVTHGFIPEDDDDDEEVYGSSVLQTEWHNYITRRRA